MKQLNNFKMRKNLINKILTFLAVATIVFAVSCTKEMSEVRLDPTLSTSETFDITSDSATVVGFVVAEGSGFTERGIAYAKTENPTIEGGKAVYTGELKKATFNVILSGLDYATKYYARAYATGEMGTVYGEEVTFTTLPVVPFLTTKAIADVTGNSASGGGEVTGNGGSEVTMRGVVFGLNPNPTTADSKTEDGKGVGAFESILSDLDGNSTYYVRSYAVNGAGTGYGPQVTFNTPIDFANVTTRNVTGIGKTEATVGGNVVDEGGGAVTERGVVYGLSSEPTVNDTKVVLGAGPGNFMTTLENLEKFTEYHIRAYAINEAGVSYGDNVKFTTLADIRFWNLPGDYVESSYPGTGLANWAPDKSPQVVSTVEMPDNLEGYVYMANSSNEWKFAVQPNWDGPNYGSPDGENLDPNAGNIVSPSGYYKINVDAIELTYTAVATVWGVIGSATPGGWDAETQLMYNPEDQQWQGGVTLTEAEFKFRANSDWSYNYGSDDADGKLQPDGGNIPVDVAADYAFSLDFSTPNEYTYVANRWGLIGDATPGGWDTDTDMTWDDVNKVLTVTVDLEAKQFKFRANDDWAINLGGSLDNLTQDGSNIDVSEAGNYTITLNPWTNKATMVKN